MSGKTLNELDEITTPDNTSEVWTRDPTVDPPDRRWSLTNVLAWLRSEFGTAVDSDVQTSLTDATADRLMKVGAFGLGGQGVTVADANVLAGQIRSGIYRMDDGPLPGALFHGNRSTTRIGDLLIDASSASPTIVRAYVRTVGDGGATSGWKELYHSGNYPSDTAWTTTTSLSNGWTGTVSYIKRAGQVTVTGQLDGSLKSSNTLLTLPSGYRPGVVVRGAAWGGGSTAVAAQINTAGLIDAASSSTTTTFTFTYPVI